MGRVGKMLMLEGSSGVLSYFVSGCMVFVVLSL